MNQKYYLSTKIEYLTNSELPARVTAAEVDPDLGAPQVNTFAGKYGPHS